MKMFTFAVATESKLNFGQ